MPDLLIRLGLWIVVLSLGLFVFGDAVGVEALAAFADHELLARGAVLGVILVIAGIVLRAFVRVGSKVIKDRCITCGRPVSAPKTLYCREHLRQIQEEEDQTLHNTRARDR